MRAPWLSLLVAGALLAPAAESASLRLKDGATLVVQAPMPGLGWGTSAVAGVREELRFSLIDQAARVTWSGPIPGSAGALGSDVSLSQNPVTGDVAVVFPRETPVGHDLVLVEWTGQAWTDAFALTSAPADERRPFVAYRSGGDALLAWTAGGADARILLRHFDLVASASAPTYSFVDLGTLRDVLPEGARAMAGEARVLGVVGAEDSLAAYVLVGRQDGSPLSAVRVELDALVDPGGFGAAPVPVTFVQSTTRSESGPVTQGPLDGRIGGPSAVAQIFEPWRLVFGGGQAWYWSEDAIVSLVAFRGGEAGRLKTFPMPSDEALLHVAAFRVARMEMGLATRGAAGPTADRRRGR